MLEVRPLGKEFQPLTGSPLAALGGVSFRVEAGQFVSVVGPSGCGKSTLLQCLVGLMRPTSGQLRSLRLFAAQVMPEFQR